MTRSHATPHAGSGVARRPPSAERARRLKQWELVALAGAGARHLAPHGWLHLTGQIGEEEFIARRYTTFEEVRRWINRELPAAARINMSREDRQLGIERRVRGYSFVTVPLFWQLTRESRTAAEVMKRVRQRGVTHQLHNAVGGAFRGTFSFPGPGWDERQLKLYQTVVRRHFRPAHVPKRADKASGAFYVFELAREPGEYPVIFLPFTEGRFRPARLLFIAGRLPEALAAAENAAVPVREVLQTRLVLGTIRAALGDYGEAVRLLEPGVRGGSVSMWDRWNFSTYGTAAANSGRYDAAIAALEKGYRIVGHRGFLAALGAALVARGQAREGRGDAPGAVADLRRAVPLLADPDLKAKVEGKIRHLVRRGGGTL